MTDREGVVGGRIVMRLREVRWDFLNAIFAATGKRIRSLPLHDLMGNGTCARAG